MCGCRRAIDETPQWVCSREAPSGRIVSTVASSTRKATAMSLGCVAMQASLTPTTACCRLNPPIAPQPLPGCAFVAGLVCVVEIGTTRPLQQIARGGRHITQLAGGAGDQRAGQARRNPAARAHPRPGLCCAPARRYEGRLRASASILSSPARSHRSGASAFRFRASSGRADWFLRPRTWRPG